MKDKEKTVTQTHYDRIIAYIEEHGSITTFEAYEQLGETKLTTRISDLRKRGVRFRATKEEGVNRYGVPVTYNRYTLAKENAAGRMIVPEVQA